MPTSAPASGRGVTPAVCQVLDAVRKHDNRAKRELPGAWLAAYGPRLPLLVEKVKDRFTPEHLAAYGPRTPHLRCGMIYLHQAWQTVVVNVDQVKKGKVDLEDVAEALLDLAAVCVKVAVDARDIATAARALQMAGGPFDG